MLAIQITDISSFMKILLCTEAFDAFTFLEGQLQTAITFSFDGTIVKDYYTSEELENEPALQEKTISYAGIRPILFDLIKGKKTPHYFKLILALKQLDSDTMHPAVSGYQLNLTYRNQILTITTGVAYHTFSLDKTPEQEWDSYMKNFLQAANVSFELLD